MKIYINGVDMGGYCIVRSAEMHEYSHGRMDALDLTFEYAEDWHRWQVQPDETVRVVHDGYDTGELYVRYLLPEGETFRLIATAVRSQCNRPGNESYVNMSLGEILNGAAARAGMQSAVYGMDASVRYPYLARRGLSPIAFVDELVRREGGALKVCCGKMSAIGYEYAAAIQSNQMAEIGNEQQGVSYEKRDADRIRRLTVRNGGVSVYAEDADAATGNEKKELVLPAADAATAGRWARGLLASLNRETEKVTLRGDFNAGFTAMGRIDLTGGIDAAGEWLIDECTHDFKNERSTAVLVRAEVNVR